MPAGRQRAYRCRMRGVTDLLPRHVCQPRVSRRAPCIRLREARQVQVNISHIKLRMWTFSATMTCFCPSYTTHVGHTFRLSKLVSFFNLYNVGITSRVSHLITHHSESSCTHVGHTVYHTKMLHHPPSSSPPVTYCAAFRFLLPWLEARLEEGETDPTLHSTLAMIYVDTNQNPKKFLLQNKHYDHKVVGAYCETRNPHLAFVAYSSAGGLCDEEAFKVSNENGLFKAQARFLVERQDIGLWAKVLTDENRHKRALVDQVVSIDSFQDVGSEAVACLIKAFMTSNLPNELITLLEKIVLCADSEFASNKNLQNLLILTAIQARCNVCMYNIYMSLVSKSLTAAHVHLQPLW